MGSRSVRRLGLILGDQLDCSSPIFEKLDKKRDTLWMAENEEETTHVWCHKLRVAFFFSAMRHHSQWLERRGWSVLYHALTSDHDCDRGLNFSEILKNDIQALRVERLLVVHPGDFRVLEMLRSTAEELNIELEILEDTHFLCTIEEFRKYRSESGKNLLLESFYRWVRKRDGLLLTPAGKPVGGRWNFDAANRETFGKRGPGIIKDPRKFAPDEVTRNVLQTVGQRFANHPGSLENFTLPVTRPDAVAFLCDFIEERLPNFGRYEDAMWTNEAFLYHSRLSMLLNVKLLHPREVIEKAIHCLDKNLAPIQSVEGFVRQIVGWREFIRGIYWTEMPEYQELNHLRAERDLPSFFWDGETDMRCVRESMNHVLEHGYSHHIHRLMVLGQFSLLYGVHPLKFHRWHMAMYLDAIDWASLPNALGMSQYGDGGIVGTKPYCASGNYINKMSNFCRDCIYDPKIATGGDACPITTLYWLFLERHQKEFEQNPRMKLQIRNMRRKGTHEMDAIRAREREIVKIWS